MKQNVSIFFSDFFLQSREVIEEYGAYNISLVNDLPLFIDPFLIFNSDNKEFKKLHARIIEYLVFLKRKVNQYTSIPDGMLKSLFLFPEVKQAWLGFCKEGNCGSGLGMDFAVALSDALKNAFKDFGSESITEGSHLEKVCLIKEGVGRDNVSDFTANLIKEHLCEFTQTFARTHMKAEFCRNVCVSKVIFHL